MTYIFKGNLRAFYCDDYFDYLCKARVKIYSTENRSSVTTAVAEREKETLRQRSPGELIVLANKLLFETETDAAGNFTVVLTDQQKYEGAAFDIDFECGNVPVKFVTRKSTPKLSKHFQFYITTVQPQWKKSSTANIKLAWWEHTIASDAWCRFLKLFGLYIICGRVVDCKERIPIQGLKVKAFDVGSAKNDHIGEANTDGAGRFKIFYTDADLTKKISPWLGAGLATGPDVYFLIENASGTSIFQEPASRGQQQDRQNIPTCFCIELCVGIDIPVPPPETLPAFLRIGSLDYRAQMQSGLFGDGLTNGNYALFGNLRLNGILARQLNGQPLEYCFEFTKYFDSAGLPIKWQRLLPAQTGSINIGYIEKVTLVNLPVPHYVFNNKDCYISSAPITGAITIPLSEDGWILAPQQMDNPTNQAGAGMFVSNGNLVALDSAMLMASPPIDLTGLVAGDDATSTGKPLANNTIFALRMLVRQQGKDTTKIEAGTCNRAAINNVLYMGMSHHTEWGAWGPVTEYGVCMLDVQQLIGGSSNKITDKADIVYSVAHPNIGSINMTLTGPVAAVDLGPIPVSQNSFGTITHHFLPSDPQCAYLVTLSATYLLTTGDENLPSVEDQIAFCR